MKKFKVILSVFMVLVLIFVSTVPFSAGSVSVDTTNCYAKIDNNLKTIINASSDKDTISVALWLSDVDDEKRAQEISAMIKRAEKNDELSEGILSSEEKFTIAKDMELSNEDLSQQAQTLVEIKREVEKELHTENNTNAVESLSSLCDINTKPVFVSRYAPLVIMEMTKEDIIKASKSRVVENIYHYKPIDIEDENLELSTDASLSIDEENTIANTTYVTDEYPYGVWQNITNINTLRDRSGFTGAGVKIGLIDNRIPDFDYVGISEEDHNRLEEQFEYHQSNSMLHYTGIGSTPAYYSSHANYALSILSGFASDYEGVAPLAEIYCDEFNIYEGGYYSAVENLVNAGVNVISASIHWGDSGTYNVISKYIDYMVSNSKVSICISAGNNDNAYSMGYVANAPTAYNAITVGNIDDKNTPYGIDDEIASNSMHYNIPNTVYKPDICAPGNRVGTYVSYNMDQEGRGGTSAACPVVAGICALLMQAAPQLKTDPMLLKSLLMCSADELESTSDIYSTATSIEPALTRECGPGMVDAYNAHITYTSGNYRSYPSSYETTINHAVNVTQKQVTAGKDIYLSLNWMQWNTVNDEIWYIENNYNVLTGYHHTLSLYDPNGVLVAVSNYQYDRKQFIRYKPLQAGRYVAKITRSYTDDLHYYPEFAVAHNIE